MSKIHMDLTAKKARVSYSETEPLILWGYEPRRGLEESETNKPPAMRVRIEG